MWYLTWKRPFIWLRRIRHRCGYGVHSPFAFNFITNVVYERAPYYKYAGLKALQKELAVQKGKEWKHEPLKVKRLLFRLVNYCQPVTMVDAGSPAASSLYLKAGKEGTNYTLATDLSELFLEAGVPVDFLYLHGFRHPDFVAEVFKQCVSRATERSIFVVEGIRYTRRMYSLWKCMQHHERTGITFDLYDLGILFFDKKRIKQDYIINF